MGNQAFFGKIIITTIIIVIIIIIIIIIIVIIIVIITYSLNDRREFLLDATARAHATRRNELEGTARITLQNAIHVQRYKIRIFDEGKRVEKFTCEPLHAANFCPGACAARAAESELQAPDQNVTNFHSRTAQTPTSGGALSMSSNRTSFPFITATASAPGCHLNSPGVSVQLHAPNVTKTHRSKQP